MSVKKIEADVIILGGGSAGTFAAIKAKETNPNCRVVVVDKGPIETSGAIGRGMDGADFDRRVANQPAEEYLRAHADTVLDNYGAPERLATALDAWWAERESSGWGKARG